MTKNNPARLWLEPVARCGCCETEFKLAEFLKLRSVGIMYGVDGKPLLDMRECYCQKGSSVSRDVSMGVAE